MVFTAAHSRTFAATSEDLFEGTREFSGLLSERVRFILRSLLKGAECDASYLIRFVGAELAPKVEQAEGCDFSIDGSLDTVTHASTFQRFDANGHSLMALPILLTSGEVALVAVLRPNSSQPFSDSQLAFLCYHTQRLFSQSIEEAIHKRFLQLAGAVETVVGVQSEVLRMHSLVHLLTSSRALCWERVFVFALHSSTLETVGSHGHFAPISLSDYDSSEEEDIKKEFRVASKHPSANYYTISYADAEHRFRTAYPQEFRDAVDGYMTPPRIAAMLEMKDLSLASAIDAHAADFLGCRTSREYLVKRYNDPACKNPDTISDSDLPDPNGYNKIQWLGFLPLSLRGKIYVAAVAQSRNDYDLGNAPSKTLTATVCNYVSHHNANA